MREHSSNARPGYDVATLSQQLDETLREMAGDPVRAAQLAERASALWADLRANQTGLQNPRSGAMKILRLPPVPPVPDETETGPFDLRWPQAGRVLAMYGCVVDSDDVPRDLGSIAVNIKYEGGDRSLVINGQGTDFALYQALFTQASPWFPLNLKVTGQDTTWQVSFRSEIPAGTERTITPALHFAFVPEGGASGDDAFRAGLPSESYRRLVAP